MIKLLIASLFTVSQAVAGLPPTSTKGQSGSKVTAFNLQAPYNQFTTTASVTSLLETGNANLLVNPSFEHSTATTGWTVTAGSTAAETTNILDEKQSLAITLSSVTGTVIDQTVTPSQQITGIGVDAGLWVKTSSSNFQVCGIQGSVEVSCTVVPSDSTWHYNVVTFSGATTVGVRLKTSSSTSGTVYIDGAYVGKSLQLGTVQQASFFGGMEQAGASGCTYAESTSSGLTSFVDLGTGTGCNAWTIDSGGTGSVAAVGTNDSRIVATNMAAGRYDLTLTGSFSMQAASGNCIFQLSDGTNVFENQAVGGPIRSPVLKFSAYYSTAQSSVTFKLRAADDQATGCAWDNGASGFASAWKINYFPTSAQAVLRNAPIYYPSYSAKVSSAGTVSDEAADFINGNCSVANTSEFTCSWNTGLFATSPTCTVTPLETGTAAPIIKVLTQATTSSIVLKTYSGSGTATAYGFNLSCQSSTASSLPAPVLVGGVVQPGSGSDNEARATITNSGTACAVSSSNTWISGTPTRNGTGRCSFAIVSGIFSSTPSCTCSARVSGGVPGCGGDSAVTLSPTNFGFITSFNGTATDTTFDVICMGPK